MGKATFASRGPPQDAGGYSSNEVEQKTRAALRKALSNNPKAKRSIEPLYSTGIPASGEYEKPFKH